MKLQDFIVQGLTELRKGQEELRKGQKMLYQMLRENNNGSQHVDVGQLLSQEVEEPRPKKPIRITANEVRSNQGDTPAVARFLQTEGA